VVCAVSWSYLLRGAGTGMDVPAMATWQFPPFGSSSSQGQWAGSYWLLMLAMWWVMMIAMMLPSAAPMVLLYGRVHHRHGQDSRSNPVVFVVGYLSSWLAFSLLATSLQWTLERSGLLDSMLMWSTNRTLSALLLMLAGFYQFTGLKNHCLIHCRSPGEWLSSHWQSGPAGALRMGAHHGLYCVGCCWGLMLMLFVGGIMNLVWIGGLAVLVLLEKLLPGGEWVASAAGGVMLLTSVYLLAS
jgi:predicted metal-binding membrane protein